MSKYRIIVTLDNGYADPGLLLASIQKWAELRTYDEAMTERSARIEKVSDEGVAHVLHAGDGRLEGTNYKIPRLNGATP